MPGGAHRYILVVDGREIELSDGEVTLGRSRSATIRVDHESVSRSHALLTFSNGTAVLKDLNSSNGTFVAGRRIMNETLLRSGDRLQVGAAVVEYRVIDPAATGEKTALLSPSAADGLPEPAVAPSSPGGAGPAAPSPLEISASDLFRGIDDAARWESSQPVAAASALAAVHSSGVTGRPSLDLPPPEQPSAARAPAPGPPPAPAPPRPLPEATLSQFPIREGRGKSAPDRPEPVVRIHMSHAPPAREAAGFFPRLLASLVDLVILLALNLLLLSPVFLVLLFREAFQSADLMHDWAFLGILTGCGLMISGANLWYVVGGWARTGRTPGKALLRLSVVSVGPSPSGAGIGLRRAFVRLLACGLSGALLGVGFVLVLFRKDRRALHDLVAGTRVVRTR